MAANDPRLKTPARKRLRAAVAQLGHPCRKCRQPIDYDGPWDLGEIIARDHGGDPLDPDNVAAEHVRCNRSAGGHMAIAKRYGRPSTTLRTSQDW